MIDLARSGDSNSLPLEVVLVWPMTFEQLQTLVEQCGGQWEILPRRERWRMMQQWREVFACRLHAQTGKWQHREFDWHIFSFNYAYALHGHRAYAAYELEHPSIYYVVAQKESQPAVRIAGGRLLNLRVIDDDFYLWPEGLDWTMAFTHEESSWGEGPYFCRKEWVVPES